MALDAILFDLDGTLVDTNRHHARAWRRAMEEFGYRIGEDRVLKEIGKSGRHLVPALLGKEADETAGEAMSDHHDRLYPELVREEGARIFDGAEHLVRNVKDRGLATAVATGSKEDSLQAVIDATGLDLFEIFDVVITDDKVENGKPSPEVIQVAARELGVSAAQTILIGDTPFDARAARAAGSLCIGVLTGVHTETDLKRAGARAVYDDVRAIDAALDDLIRVASPPRIHFTERLMRDLMDVALEEARAALADDDVPVGAALVDGDGGIVARGRSYTESTGNFLLHAEMQAFQEIAGKFPLEKRELVLVTTLEPCMMCFGAAMGARVDTIICGMRAPSNGGFARCEPMQSPGMIMPRLVTGVGAEESRALFTRWLQRHPEAMFVQDLLSTV